MRRFVTVLAVLAALFWSAVVWGGYALLAGAGTFLAQNAGTVGLPPEAVQLAGWAQALFESFGHGTALVLWLLGLGLIGVVLTIVNTLVGRAALARPRGFEAPLPPGEVIPPAAPPRRNPPVWGRDAANR